MADNTLAVFENHKIRRHYDEQMETWYFSVVDILQVLIQQRMMRQETRNKLTDYRQDHEITREDEFAALTNIIHQEWSGVSVKKHKNIKGLKTQNLRDHMSEAELIFTALAELSTRQIAESVDATGMVENADAGKKGGKIAKKQKRIKQKPDKNADKK